MFIMLGIKFIWVGLLTFGTIRFLHCRYVQRIVDYGVLTQSVPRINLIKISHSQHLHYFHHFFIWRISMMMSPS